MLGFRSLASLGALAAVAACQSTDPTATDALLTLEAARVAGEAAAQDVEVMRGPAGPLGFGLRADLGRFDCEPASRHGLSVTRTCTYRDAAGNVQSAYDPVTTASVNVRTEISGTLSREGWSATMQRVTDLTASGLAGQETSITWNGTESGSSSRVRTTSDGEPREFAMTHSGTVSNVVIPVPRTPTSWPLSGTITRTMTIAFSGGPRDGETVQRTVTITFKGTQYATVTVNGETFEFDLAARGRPKRGGQRP